MNILVTGGAGFIGSHLCRVFVERKYFVICVDNFITGSRENIRPLLDKDNFKLIEHDISEPLYLDEDLDWVFHFASLASPKYYLNYPIKTLKSGLLGTYNCLGIAKAKKAKFFLASTSEVYGDPQIHPQPEEYNGNVNIVGQRSCYDESKRAAEALTYAYKRVHNLSVRVARIFNTFGPNMKIDDGRVVSNFIVQALKGKPLTVYGEGKQTRSFCYIDDLIRGILALTEADYQQPLNLGNPQEFKIINLAQKIISLTRSSSQIRFFPLLEDDPKRRKPDITKARKILDWKPEVSLEEGLTKTIAYFKDKLG
ncbi:MAG: SDR family NAD-dependent epimerase/dehydratase [Candidatus Omnitrophota bacterium]|nr:MAG: SDR family NAD-dependent epimerase/dehydratase [Candidatus Omnitrophota bacterium]RKY35415.1 MAG: SDR family NAD-dependent epimerase/dehydratase [Candidatus Omnitrophota bacterium]RKY44902.1 MAG: SDR family NAD-dependent epimerase/dehydratase [Candidatus Omnitrophota bacterium]